MRTVLGGAGLGALAASIVVVRACLSSRATLLGALRESEGMRGLEELASGGPSSASARELLEMLVRTLVDGECVLVAGAGLGAAHGLPTWSDLLRRTLLELAGEIPDAALIDARRSLAQGSYDDVLAAIDRLVPIDRRAAVMAEALGAPATSRAALSRALSGLPFAGAITNLWRVEPARAVLGEDAQVLRPQDAASGLVALRRRQQFILQAYGDIASLPLVADERELEEMLRLEPQFARLLNTIVAANSLLFVGMSLDGVEELLHVTEPQLAGRRHFALVPQHPGDELRTRQLERRYGLHVLVYAASPDHAGALEFAERLEEGVDAERSRRRERPPQRRLPSERALTLERVALANVGPFASLDVRLHPRLTVLLGDNGSGKSSVLRAIALGLGGDAEASRRAAARALKVGESQGSIQLTIDSREYRTALSRDDDRVSVRSDPIGPVASGLLLGLGFPPLRGVSTVDVDGPLMASRRAPSPEDLRPLTVDVVDERLDDVRQWMVNTALLAEDRAEGESAWMTLRRFFKILDALTPDFTLSYHGMDKRNWEVLVATDDGVIPLMHLSRGITAIFGWVGVLIQRLGDIFDDDTAPEAQHVLLLVDEIDVHLHPEWQRRILPVLLEAFPGLQIVATTHSALVVGSISDASLLHLKRTHGRIVAEPVPAHFGGWRADQILTSSAFELRTSRDLDTERRMREYERPGVSSGEDDRRLASELAERTPGPFETEQERLAARLVGEALERQHEELSPERKREVLALAEQYLARLRDGGTASAGPALGE
jgi:putative AbiEii toxin of type IV toxin-antitoxin system/SIR2-like protein